MAAQGGQYAVTATATSLTDALGLSGGVTCRQIDIKNAEGALNTAYVGGSGVTNVPANAWAELEANRAWSSVAHSVNSVNTDTVYVVGTVNAANILFIALVT